jgi:protease I
MFEKTRDYYQPDTRNAAASNAILIMTANKTEDLEFFYPYYRFIEAGFRVDVVTPNGGEFKGKQGLSLQESGKIKDVKPEKYALLYIPGGKAPAELKKNADAVDLVRVFAASGKPIAAICHGAQMLAAAGVIEGRKIAAWPDVKDEVEEAGATYANEETVVDGQFITARWPGDLPRHLAITLKEMHYASQSSQDKRFFAA